MYTYIYIYVYIYIYISNIYVYMYIHIHIYRSVRSCLLVLLWCSDEAISYVFLTLEPFFRQPKGLLSTAHQRQGPRPTPTKLYAIFDGL